MGRKESGNQSIQAQGGLSIGYQCISGPAGIDYLYGEHSESEERWATLGRAENGQYLVVVHTYETITTTQVRIRINSARKADTQEIRDYEDAPH